MRRYFVIILLIFSACNKGLAPEEEVGETGFSGTITFRGNWPEGVTRTHIVLFKNPLLSISDFSALNLRFVSDSIKFGSNEFHYNSFENSLEILPIKLLAGDYSYLAVAQSKTSTLSLNRNDWKVVGVYYNQGNSITPGILSLQEGKMSNSVNILCDFTNPPPQPPKSVNQ